MRACWPLFFSLLLTACSESKDDNDPPADAASFDAALGADSGEILPDAGATSVCGSGDNQVLCSVAIEICVETDFDGTVLAECQALPDGCSERNCANCLTLCEGLTCEESGNENAITCVSQ